MQFIDDLVEMFQQVELGNLDETSFLVALNESDFMYGEVYDYWVATYNVA